MLIGYRFTHCSIYHANLSENTIDDTLLLIALGGLILYYAFILVTAAYATPTIYDSHGAHSKALAITYACLNIIQVRILYSAK